MWNPKHISKRAVKLDFRASGQDFVQASQIYFDDKLFCNAVELLDLDADKVQFVVCSECGYAGCSPGNWLAIRRVNNFVFLIPAFSSMEGGEWELSEYDAPFEVRKNGAIFLRLDQYEELRVYIPGLVGLDSICTLRMNEVARMIQWEAPYHALNLFPHRLEFKRDLYLATNSPLEEGIVKELSKLLELFDSSTSIVTSLELIEGSVAIFLDTNDFAEWHPLFEKGGTLGLRLDPNFGFLA